MGPHPWAHPRFRMQNPIKYSETLTELATVGNVPRPPPRIQFFGATANRKRQEHCGLWCVIFLSPIQFKSAPFLLITNYYSISQ